MGKFLVRKSADGKFNLVGAFSNRWRDWDFHAQPTKGGEIVSSAAHKEYEQWLDANAQHAPQLMLWHTWGTEFKHRANWWAFSDNFMYANWPLEPEEAELVEKWAAEETLGMSFGFYVLDYDKEAGAVEKYRAFEASILPAEAAANVWTAIQVVKKSQGEIMNKSKYDALAKLHGTDFADKLLENEKQIAELLDQAGIDTKEFTEEGAGEGEAAPAEPAAEEKQAEEPAAEEAADPESVKASDVVAALTKLEGAFSDAIKGLAERVAVLEGDIAKARQAVEAERKAAAMPPSILQAYMPKSILEDPAPAAAKSAAQVDGRSSLVRQGPATPETENSWFASLANDMR